MNTNLMSWKDLALFINGLTPEQQDLPAVCYHDYEEEYQPISILSNDDGNLDTPIAYLMFEEHQGTPHLNANWVSVWDSGVNVRTKCHYDSVKNVVTDIVGTDIDGLEDLVREYVELSTGKTISIYDLAESPY